jgi:hypothetical protein
LELLNKPDFGFHFSETAVPREVAQDDLQEEQPGAGDDPWWGPGTEGSQVQHGASFPEFRQNNQLSYPLIYSYLASTEEQVRALQ